MDIVFVDREKISYESVAESNFTESAQKYFENYISDFKITTKTQETMSAEQYLFSILNDDMICDEETKRFCFHLYMDKSLYQKVRLLKNNQNISFEPSEVVQLIHSYAFVLLKNSYSILIAIFRFMWTSPDPIVRIDYEFFKSTSRYLDASESTRRVQLLLQQNSIEDLRRYHNELLLYLLTSIECIPQSKNSVEYNFTRLKQSLCYFKLVFRQEVTLVVKDDFDGTILKMKESAYQPRLEVPVLQSKVKSTDFHIKYLSPVFIIKCPMNRLTINHISDLAFKVITQGLKIDVSHIFDGFMSEMNENSIIELVLMNEFIEKILRRFQHVTICIHGNEFGISDERLKSDDMISIKKIKVHSEFFKNCPAILKYMKNKVQTKYLGYILQIIRFICSVSQNGPLHLNLSTYEDHMVKLMTNELKIDNDILKIKFLSQQTDSAKAEQNYSLIFTFRIDQNYIQNSAIHNLSIRKLYIISCDELRGLIGEDISNIFLITDKKTRTKCMENNEAITQACKNTHESIVAHKLEFFSIKRSVFIIFFMEVLQIKSMNVDSSIEFMKDESGSRFLNIDECYVEFIEEIKHIQKIAIRSSVVVFKDMSMIQKSSGQPNSPDILFEKSIFPEDTCISGSFRDIYFIECSSKARINANFERIICKGPLEEYRIELFENFIFSNSDTSEFYVIDSRKKIVHQQKDLQLPQEFIK